MFELLRPLLGYLSSTSAVAAEWQAWRLARITGGHNNILFRASGYGHDIAVKFTRRDERDRAGREYHALLALHGLGEEARKDTSRRSG